jgi:hypothetical protein
MTRNGDGSRLYVTTESSINSEVDKRRLLIYEFDTGARRYTGRTLLYTKDSSDFITGAVMRLTRGRSLSAPAAVAPPMATTATRSLAPAQIVW